MGCGGHDDMCGYEFVRFRLEYRRLACGHERRKLHPRMRILDTFLVSGRKCQKLGSSHRFVVIRSSGVTGTSLACRLTITQLTKNVYIEA